MVILPRVNVMQSLYSEKENDLFDELLAFCLYSNNTFQTINRNYHIALRL